MIAEGVWHGKGKMRGKKEGLRRTVVAEALVQE